MGDLCHCCHIVSTVMTAVSMSHLGDELCV